MLIVRMEINRSHFGIETARLSNGKFQILEINRSHFGIETPFELPQE